MKKIIRLTESDLTRIVKRVIKENESYDDFEFIDANSYGIVEHGNVIIEIDGEEIILTIEESSHGDFRVFLDDMDKKDLIPSEFDGKTEDEITNSEFVDAVRDFYEATTREKR